VSGIGGGLLLVPLMVSVGLTPVQPLLLPRQTYNAARSWQTGAWAFRFPASGDAGTSLVSAQMGAYSKQAPSYLLSAFEAFTGEYLPD